MKSLVATLALSCGLPGCEAGPVIVDPAPPSKSGIVYPDLPAPDKEYVYTQNVSDSSPGAAFRVVSQRLEAKHRSAENAVKFYKDILPRHGWTLESEAPASDGFARLAFTNRSERCLLEIKDLSRDTVGIVLKVTRKD